MQLKEFLEKHGSQLAAVVENKLTPLHNPLKPTEKDEDTDKRLAALLRKPLPVQGELIKGIKKALDAGRNHIFIVGEMGSGKTMVALSTVWTFDKPRRALVVCPTHLVEKWKREAKDTIPGVQVVDLSVRNVITMLESLRCEKNRPAAHEIYVISKERAKLSYGWRPAACKKAGSKLPHCPDCGKVIKDKKDAYVSWKELSRKRYACNNCGSPLWQADNKLRRYSAADYIKKYLKDYFDLVVLDEIQDYKAGESLQGLAMGALLSAAPRCLCLTGTLNGGYADDLFHLLFRMEPETLKRDGFSHGGAQKWLESFGTIETVTKVEDEDNYYGRGRKKSEIVRKRPGVSPVVIGKYLLDKAVFIRLSDVIDGLPQYEENVVTISMDAASGQLFNYKGLENGLRNAVKQFKNRAISSMLQALLSYPDSCALFPEHIEITDKETEEILALIEAPVLELGDGELLPKERELVELVKQEKQQNRKVLCYLTFTNTRDIRPRLKKVLEHAGLRVGVLDASVEPKKREAWINRHTKDIDVLLVNAELVKTGLDLYDFPTVVFYQIGYNIFTLRQAARRSWRIGQTKPVRVYFFCYEGTMQEIALTLIARKLETALMVEGDLPEGLAEYAAEGSSIIEEMGKALVDGGKYRGAEAAWANFRKREIETQLGIAGKETIFTEKTVATVKKNEPMKTSKTTINDNVVIRVSLVEGKKKRQSTIEVKYGDLDTVAAGKPVQFAMF